MEKGLIITAIGMGLVFVLIIILWGIMAFLVKVTEKFKGKSDDDAQDETEEEAQIAVAPAEDKAQLAAAIAAASVVAMTLKTKKTPMRSLQTSGSTLVSPTSNWLNTGRVRQILARKGR